MDNIISKLISHGSTTVGAVEALLILSEWAPQRLQDRPIIGRGEEDQGAWMQIGVAIRLAYLQGLEQTGLLRDKSQWTEEFERKRVAWTGKHGHLSPYLVLLNMILTVCPLTFSMLHERSRSFHSSRERVLVPRSRAIHYLERHRLPDASNSAGRIWKSSAALPGSPRADPAFQQCPRYSVLFNKSPRAALHRR